MSNLTLSLKSAAAIGAALALTLTASADVKTQAPPKPDEAKALANGLGETIYQQGDVESEGDLALNTIAPKKADGLGAIIAVGSVNGDAKPEGDIIVSADAGCEPYPACARNQEHMEEDIKMPAAPIAAGGVEGEGPDTTPALAASRGFEPIAGAALGVKGSGGEDRLIENFTLKSTEGNPRRVDREFLHVGAVAAPNTGDTAAPTASDERLAASNGRPTQKSGMASPTGDTSDVDPDAPRQIGGDDPINGIDIIIKKRPEDRN